MRRSGAGVFPIDLQMRLARDVPDPSGDRQGILTLSDTPCMMDGSGQGCSRVVHIAGNDAVE